MVTERSLHFYSTQARILMAEWVILAKLIMAHSIPAKEKKVVSIEDLESFDIENLENINFGTSEELPHIMAEKNINIAMQGPFGAMLKEKMAVYAAISRVRLEIHVSKEELFKTKRTTPEEQRIPEKKLEKLSFSLLDELQNQLDELTQQHDQEWQEFIQSWTDALLAFFTQSQLTLTEREVKELKDEDIATELLPRFIEVGLKPPKPSYPQMSCTDYLQLKAFLTIQSALSRQHLPHDDAQIQQKLLGFKSELAKMQKQEQELLAEQKNLSAEILSRINL
jgi:hypothetical protein